MRLTNPSYLFHLKVHLYLSLKNDQRKDQQSQTKLSLNQKKKKKKLKGIEEVREFEEVLYNSKHEKYYNKDKKEKAWKWIASQLISRGFSEIEDAQINEKITSLRSSYGTEKREKSIKN